MPGKRKPKFRKVGWIGIVDDDPYFQQKTSNEYREAGEPPALVAEIFKRKRDASKRFQVVRRVFIEDQRERGPE